MAGRDEDSLAVYRRAVELMPDDPPSEALALVLAAEGQALMLCDRTAESNSRCEEALDVARTVGAEAVEAHVLNTMSANLSAVGETDRAVDAARQALTIARRLRLPDEIQRSYVNGSASLDEAGRVEESIAMAREGIASARELGVDRQWGDVLRADVFRMDLVSGVVEINKIAGANIDRADAEPHCAGIDQVKIHQAFERSSQRGDIVIADRLQCAVRL